MTTTGTYISKNHHDRYGFKITKLPTGVYRIDCPAHPSFNGKDPTVDYSHLYSRGEVCFIAGKEPRTYKEATLRAGEWAEFFSRYRRTGKTEK